MNINNSIHFYYAGVIILLSLVLGGGTTQGLWTDHILEILMIPAIFMGIWQLNNSRFSNLAICFIILLFSYFVLQFLPISRQIIINNSQIIINSSLFSFSPQKSLETVLFATSVIGFSLFLSNLKDNELSRLIRFFLVGLVINLILGAFQLSYSGATNIEGFLPYTITSATFANENHFSTLAFSMIPLIAFHYLVRIRAPGVFIFISAIIIFILFAVGSRAGMAMALAMSALCYIWFAFDKMKTTLKVCVIFSVFLSATVVISLVIGLPDSERIVRDDFVRNTLMAFYDNIAFGTGLGSFIEVYPSYEPLDETRKYYVNHAHNEYAEILLETGLLGAVIMLFFTILIILGIPRSKLSQAAGLGILAIAAHSIIDYPLRTMAIAILFSFYISIILSSKSQDQ